MSKSSFDATNGAQTVVIERKNAGVEEIKVGGAALVWVKYQDGNGTPQVIGGSYYKWADEPSSEQDDGASSLTATAALALAAIAALW